MLEFTIPQNLCTIVSSHWPHHHGEGTKRKEKEKKGKKKKEIDLMAANKLVALWNHPAGPKTSTLSYFCSCLFSFLNFFLLFIDGCLVVSNK